MHKRLILKCQKIKVGKKNNEDKMWVSSDHEDKKTDIQKQQKLA